jgi:hypothetical protein
LSVDEAIVIGGTTETAEVEKRSWNPKINDYEFAPAKIEGIDLIEKGVSYDSALPTFLDVISKEEKFPPVEPTSRLIFGNEVDCFLIEVTKDLNFYFYKSPMKLQQKSGQNSVRTDPNFIFLAGGTDFSRTKISSKVYKFTFSDHEVAELAKLKVARYFPVMVNDGPQFYVVGGKIKGGSVTNSVEMINIGTPGATWAEAPMKHKRFGHFAWACKGKLYVMGGTSEDKGKPIEEVEVYDSATKAWSVHPSKISLT